MAPKIFISYRRDETAGYAGRVRDQLVEKLGSKVFMDVDNIRLGTNFITALNEEVAKCRALLAVIGPDWLDARDKKGQRRLDNPHDFVRLEIGAALKRQIPVIPILLLVGWWGQHRRAPDEIHRLQARAGNTLELRGPCYSACTLLTAYVARDKLCVAPGAFLAFHAAREHDSGALSLDSTNAMYRSQPPEVRAWIDRNGGWQSLPLDGFWTMYDRDLWAMGYQRCASAS